MFKPQNHILFWCANHKYASQIAAQVLYEPLIIAHNDCYRCIYFAINSLPSALKFIQPTRAWKKIEENVRLIAKKRITYAYNKRLGGNNKIPYSYLYRLINKLIFQSIKSKLGFNQ
eukprot:52932_1